MKRDMLSQEEFNRLREIKRRNRGELFRLPNVNGVGIGFKEVSGKPTDQIAIRVYVERKLTRGKLKKEELIPSEIEGMVTDVIKLGEISPCAHLTRERPARGGASIGNCGDLLTTGTLGGLFRDNTDGTRVILSNNHVIARAQFEGDERIIAGTRIPQPSWVDDPQWTGVPRESPGTCPGDNSFAILKRWKPIVIPPQANRIDAAIAQVINPSDIISSIHDIGEPVGCRALTIADIGTVVRKSGRTTGLTQGTVTDIAFDVVFTYVPWKPNVLFEDQIFISGMIVERGDSGSLIVDVDGYIVGLIFLNFGTAAGGNHINDVLSELNISCWEATTSTSTTTSSTSTSTTTISTSTTTISTSTTTGTSTSTSATTMSTSTTTVSTSTTTTLLPSRWTIETAATGPGHVGYGCSLAFDASGYPHISHRRGDSPNRALMYTYKDASGWHTETVDAVDPMRHTSIDVDSAGYPHISYYKYAYLDGDLKYAYKDVGGWHIETIDSAGDVGRFCALVLDGNDHAHIAYQREDPQDQLKYACNSSGSWDIVILASGGGSGYGRSGIVLDGDGYPHIAAPDGWTLAWFYKDGTGWHTDDSLASYYVNAGTSIGLDSDGYPHCTVCEHAWEPWLRHVYKDADGWHDEVIDAGPDVGWTHSLVMLNDSPVVAYQGNNSDDAALMYAYRDGEGWHSEVVDGSGEYKGWDNFIRLDRNGNPAIAYSDLDNYHLKYASFLGISVRIAALDQIDDRILYIEGTLVNTGVIGVSTTVVSVRGGPPEVIVDEQGGCISLACNTTNSEYHIAWLEYDATNTYERIMYCKSSDGGSIWGTPVQIAIVPAAADEFYSVRVVGDPLGKLFILFQFEDDDGVGATAYQVYLYRSLDSGDSWDLIQTWTSAHSYCDIQVDSSGNIYVFYRSDASPYNHVCRKSTDNGDTFSAEVTVVSTPGSRDFKAELDDSDNIHVIYEKGSVGDPYHTKSVDGGANFSAGVQIAAGTWAFPGQVPWFAIDGNNIYFVWGDDATGNLMYSYSGDAGATWAAPVDTGFSGTVGFGNDIEPYEQGSQCVLYHGSTILYVFGDNHFPGTFNYLGSMTSGDGGATWTQASIVDYGKNNHWHPSLATYFIGPEVPVPPVAVARTYFFLA